MAASIAGILLSLVALFQLCLACGAPWGSVALGGKYPGKLPFRLRIAALVQFGLLAFIALIIFIRAGMMLPDYLDWSRKAIWGVVAFMSISSVLNLITPSKWERRIWAPVALLLLVCSVVVARSA